MSVSLRFKNSIYIYAILETKTALINLLLDSVLSKDSTGFHIFIPENIPGS